MKASPTLADIDRSKVQFRPGDRVMVRVSSDLTESQTSNLVKATTKFCGEDVRVMVANCTKLRMIVCKPDGSMRSILGPDDFQLQPISNPEVANVSCTVVDIQEGDTILLSHINDLDHTQKLQIEQYVRNWTGKSVELKWS